MIVKRGVVGVAKMNDSDIWSLWIDVKEGENHCLIGHLQLPAQEVRAFLANLRSSLRIDISANGRQVMEVNLSMDNIDGCIDVVEEWTDPAWLEWQRAKGKVPS